MKITLKFIKEIYQDFMNEENNYTSYKISYTSVGNDLVVVLEVILRKMRIILLKYLLMVN